MIRTYSSDGLRLRDYSESAIEKLAALGRVIVTFRVLASGERRMACATFCPQNGSRIRASAHMGQTYSFREKLPNGSRAWKHADLLSPASIRKLAGKPLELEEIDLYLRRVFRAVPLSCLSK